MDNHAMVSYCGLYCDLCGARGDTPDRARALIVTLKQAEMDEWGRGMPDFVEFWRFLNSLADVPDDKCCRSGKCGAPNCALRNCAKAREVEVCALCSDFPCDYLHPYADFADMAWHNTKVFNLCLMKKMGLDAWAREKARSVRDVYTSGKWTL